MIQNRDYLKDFSFLLDLTERRNKEIYIKVISLDFRTENEIGEVEGLVINGNLSVDGTSSVRRTGNLSIFCNTKLYEGDPLEKDINYYKLFFGLSKKINIEIGLLNDFNNKYPKIIWFQMGTYIITNSSFSNNINGGITININIGDKMNLLNGYCGGTISASTEIDKISDIDKTGKKYNRKASIYELILELVNHIGEEQLGKILISDLDPTTKTGLKLKDNCEKKYYITEEDNNVQIKEYIEGESPQEVEVYSSGDFIGYQKIEYTYPNKDYFTLNAGETITTGLDKIKSTLGNYEYFYDLNGNFRWQEIRNYKNTSKASMDLKNLTNKDYLVDIDNGNALYNFEDSKVITSYSNNPYYSNLKNDFIIWGTRVVGEDSEKKTYPIRYHLAIDDKPILPGNYNEKYLYLLLEDEDDDGRKEYIPPIYYKTLKQLPSVGEEGAVYFIQEDNGLYKYNVDNENYIIYLSKDKATTVEAIAFYQKYNEVRNETDIQIKDKEDIFSKLNKNIIDLSKYLSWTINAFNTSFVNKNSSVSEIGNSLSDYKNKINQINEDIQKLAKESIEGIFLDKNKKEYGYDYNKEYSKIKDFTLDKENIFNNNFEWMIRSFNIYHQFLINYNLIYQKNLLNYEKQLNIYLKYFIEYEKEQDKTQKENIKKKANDLFTFISTDVERYKTILNIYAESPNSIENYYNNLQNRIKNFYTLLKECYKDGRYFLNESYKIGNGKNSSQFYNYINKNLNFLFNDNILELLYYPLNQELKILITDFQSLSSKWDIEILQKEITSIEEKIINSIDNTESFVIIDDFENFKFDKNELISFNNKEAFPELKDADDTILYLDFSTGTLYTPLKKAGYYSVKETIPIKYIFPRNWQTLLFLQNLDVFSSEKNIYSTELKEEWTSLFELVPYINESGEEVFKGTSQVYVDKIKESVYSQSSSLNYWLDLIDSKAMDFNKLKISNIGRRTLVQKNDKVNCLFAPIIPDYIIIENIEENKKLIQELKEKGQKYILVDANFLSQCETNGLAAYSAFDSISNTLYNYLGFNNTINITCLPMFFLEPNVRIKLRDEASDIFGDYIIKNFSISLNNLSSMNITCTKVIDSI